MKVEAANQPAAFHCSTVTAPFSTGTVDFSEHTIRARQS